MSSEQQYQSLKQLLLHIQKPAVLVDSELSIVEINDWMREIFSVSAADNLSGQKLTKWFETSTEQLLAQSSSEFKLLSIFAAPQRQQTFECLTFSENSELQYFLLISPLPEKKLTLLEKANFILNLTEKKVTFNEAGAKLCRFAPHQSQLPWDTFLTLLKTENRQRFMQTVDRVAETGKKESTELAIQSGEDLLVLKAELQAVRSVDQNVTDIKIALNDISKSWQRRNKLEQTTGLISDIRAVTAIGIWEANLTKRTLYWSDETCKLFGVIPESFDGRNETFISLLLPEDKPNFGFGCIQQDGSFELEYRIRRQDNQELRWLYNRGKQIIDPVDEHSVLRLGVVMDITDRKRLDKLHQLEAKMLQALSTGQPVTDILDMIVLGVEKIVFDAVASIMLVDLPTNTLVCASAPNVPKPYLAAIEGISIGPGMGSCGSAAFNKQAVIVADIETDEHWQNYNQLALAHNLRACWSTPVINRDGIVLATFCVYYHTPKHPSVLDLQALERVCQIIGIALEKENDEKRLKLSEQRFTDVFNESATGIAIADVNGRFIEVNKAFCMLLGYTEKEILETNILNLTHPEDRASNTMLINELLDNKRQHFLLEKRYITKDKNIVWVRMSVTAQRDPDGKPVRIFGISENITDRVHAEQQLSDLFTNLPGMAYRCRVDNDWTMLFVSPAIKNIFGYQPSDIINNARTSMVELINPEDRKRVDRTVNDAVVSGKPFQVEYRIQHADGSERWVWEQGKAVAGDRQNELLLDGYITDITDLKQSELALKSSEQRFQLLCKATNDAIWDWDLKTNTLWWNEGFENLFGFLRDEVKPTIESWTDGIHPNDRHDVMISIGAFIANEQNINVWSAQYQFRRADGQYVHVIDRAFLIRDDNGQAIRMVGGMNDITDRIELEEHLRQAQRMESIGQLTGGVAHDFNNLLTVMQGNAEMIADRVQDNPLLSSMADMIVSAAYRGSELTQSLLAFARKQPLVPKATDINALINKFQPLFFRTLGEHIRVQLNLQEQLNKIIVDPGLLENALLNLCINARDAMENGGALTIETQSVHLDEDSAQQYDLSPGDYVMVIVSDTGSGISPDNLKHVFEPFFTTKRKSEGTGLGLAMVYGFVKQSDGHINIDSALNKGTRLQLYLPVSNLVSTDETEKTDDASFESLAGEEVILLVEDDEMVRQFAREQLQMLGYRVIYATNGHEAIEILQSNASIDLLFTDVVMPGMSGKELADKAKKYHPFLKVLFTSGYTGDAISHQGRLDPGVLLLSKPYRPIELAKKIRAALEN